jgi:hypothetical protein
MDQGGGMGGWVFIVLGVFILWLAWGGRHKLRRNTSLPDRVVLVPVSAIPVRRKNSPLLLLFVGALLALLVFGGGWALDHAPLLPFMRR